MARLDGYITTAQLRFGIKDSVDEMIKKHRFLKAKMSDDKSSLIITVDYDAVEQYNNEVRKAVETIATTNVAELCDDVKISILQAESKIKGEAY